MGRQIATFATLIMVLAGSTNAEVIVLGPTPYLSIDDSLFDLSGLGSTFFLDDLEDNRVSFGLLTNGTITPPGLTTDSVDADDGAIDGFGNGGHSLESTSFTVHPTSPLTFVTSYVFSFSGLASSVNAFGFVWTDAFEFSDLTISANNQHWNFPGSMDATNAGTTLEDRFVGIISTSALNVVEVRCWSYGLLGDRCELDHIQFGIQPVPEPIGRIQLLMLGASFICFSAQIRRRNVCIEDLLDIA